MSQTLLFPAVIILLVVARFLFRELRERKIALARVYVLPGILVLIGLVLTVTTLTMAPGETAALALATIVALAIGSAIGLAVGHFTTVRLGELPNVVYARGSPVTVAIWIAALALRLVARSAIPSQDSSAAAEANTALIFMLAAALGMVRYRILVRARIARMRGKTEPVAVV